LRTFTRFFNALRTGLLGERGATVGAAYRGRRRFLRRLSLLPRHRYRRARAAPMELDDSPGERPGRGPDVG